MATALPTYPPFDCRSKGKAVRWSKWVKRLHTLFTGYNISNDKRKQALLLSFGGEDVHDIFDTFEATQLKPEENKTYYETTVELFTSHCNPKSNAEYQKYVFRHTAQETDKTDDLYTTLRHLAPTCLFTNNEAEIKSQIISGCRLEKVRRKGLSDPQITLEKLHLKNLI